MADEAKETNNETEGFEVFTTEAVDHDEAEQEQSSEADDQETQGEESAKAQQYMDEEQDTDDNTEDADNADDAGAEDKPKKIGRFQKRIDRLTKRASEAERRAAEAEARLRELEGKGDSYTDPDDEPDPGDYESYSDYLDALADWKSAQKGKTADDKSQGKAKEKNQEQEPESDPEFDDAIAEVTEAFDETRSKYKDFDEVISQQDLTITKDMVKALAETDDPGEVAYYLGKHKDEATRIAALPPLAQAKEIGKLEARLQQKPGKKLPSAPDPISPVKGGDSKRKTVYEADSFREFERLRNEQDAKRGSGW